MIRAGAFDAVETARLRCSATRTRGFQVRRQFTGFLQGQRFCVKKLDVPAINLRGLDRHRAVDVNGKWLERLALERAGQQIQKQLRSPNCKCRDENFPLCLDGFGNDFSSLNGSLHQRFVIAVAIGRFHEDHVSVLERHGIFMKRRAARANIAGKDDDLFPAIFFDRHLNTGRTKNVPRFDPARDDSRRDFGWLIIFDPLIEQPQFGHVFFG